MTRTVCLLALLTSGCGATFEEFIWTVQPYQVPCVAETTQLCRLVKTDDDASFTRLFDEIEDWTFVWGVESRLRVQRRDKLSTGSNDAFFYTLETELKATVIDPTDPNDGRFAYSADLSAPGGETALTLDAGGDGGALLDGTPFVCATPEVCDDLEAYLGANGQLQMQFQFGDDPTADPLIATSANLQQ